MFPAEFMDPEPQEDALLLISGTYRLEMFFINGVGFSALFNTELTQESNSGSIYQKTINKK